MAEATAITPSALKDTLETVIQQMGDKDLHLQPDVLKEYCQLTGHDFTFYQGRDRVPLGFLMTFTASLVSELFIAFLTQLADSVKGVVHSSSTIDVAAPFRISQESYRHAVRLAGITEKEGRKGTHFVVDLDLTLLQEDGVKVLTDVHQFFLRV